MADNRVSSSRQSQDASSTSAQRVQPSSSALIGSDGSTVIQANTATAGINPTQSSNVAGPFVTSPGQSDKTQLYSSSSGSSQFPMQHSTQQLPSNTVPIATTQFTKTDALTTDNQNTKVTAGLNSSSRSDVLKDSSVIKDSSISMATADISSSSAHSQNVSSVSNPTNVSSSHLDSSEYEPSVSSTESATSFNSKSISTSLSLTSATVVPQIPAGSSVKLKASVSSSSEYLASSGEMYNPITASKTLYSSSIIALDSSAALKTTPVTPLTPPSVKPVGPSDTGSTSLLGGGLSNYYVYIGVPLCGLGILIFLIVCVICLRKRKTKSQGSPAKNHVQDLWVNSQPEISMAPQQGPPLEEGHLGRGGDIIGGQKELALRKRKTKKSKLKQPETVSDTSFYDRLQNNNSKACISRRKGKELLGEIIKLEADRVIEEMRKQTEDNDNDNAVDNEENEDKTVENDQDTEAEKSAEADVLDKDIDDRGDGKNVEDAAFDYLEDDNETNNDDDDCDDVDAVAAAFDYLDDENQTDEVNDDDDEKNVDGDDGVDSVAAAFGYLDDDDDDTLSSGTDGELHADDDVGEVDDSWDEKQQGACTTYECMYDFAASLETHLTLHKGDQVRVHRKEDNGWWRGTTGDTTGWFPANYVQAAPQVKLETENEVEMHNDSHVTSFMVKKQAEDRQRDSYPTEDEIRAEPIYCKIQPKEKRKSLPGNGDKTPTKYATMLNRESTITPIDDGSKYMAIYDYNGHFHGELSLTKGDIIQGREQDRNGWMAGYNETSKEDGWFPTVYVQKIEKEEPCELDLDPASYKRLEVNTRSDSKQDLIGIVHKAINTFTAEKAGDLEFDVGQLITVFQVLENGWWLGCKDKTVGWFPGAFVQMVDQPSPRAKTPSPTNVPKPSSDSPVTTDNTNTPSGLSTPKTSKLRPARKAPPPPKQEPYTDATTSTPSVTSTPKVNRPKTCPPTPPQRSGFRDEISPLYETIGQNKPTDSGKSPTTDGLYELIKHPDADSDPSVTIPPKDKTKPAIPKRYIKPKLVTVRRSEVNMPNSLTRDSSTLETPRSRPPPPQRPTLPKLGPVRSKLQAPKTIGDQSQSEDEDNFFNISTQSKLEPLIRQESSDHDESVSYKGLSSFGSTFGSTFGRKETSPPKMNNESTVTPSDNVESGRIEEVPKKGIPKLVKQPAIVDKDIKKDNEHLPAQSNMQKPKEKTQENRNKETLDLGEIINDNINISKGDTNIPEANIENQIKKEKPVSKLPPPKHISLKPTADPVVQSENKDTKSPGTPKSKLPSMHETEDVSKVPMSYKDIQHNKIEDSNLKDESLLNKVPIKSDELSAKDAISGASNNISVVNDRLTPDEELRPRTDSFDKPPVAPKPKSKGLPKLLPKPKAGLKTHESDDDNKIVHNLDSNTDVDHSMSNSPDVRGRKSESEEDSEPKRKEEPKASKLPLGSKIAQKSPQVKGKKSKIPASPIVKKKGSDSSDKQLTIRKTSESDSDAPLSPNNIRQKPESPRSPRKASPRQKMANNETTSLRQRSNSPRAKGIPTSVRQRSSSPATKLPKSSNIPSPATPNMPNKSSSGLVPPKKVTNGQGRASPNEETDSLRSQSTPSPDTSLDQSFDNQDSDSLSPKPDRPSKPPRVLKQKSVDGKPPKKGKSLLPVIHKSMDAGSSPNGVSPSPGSKNKRGIPVAKPPRPPGPKSQSEETENGGPIKRTLNQAMKGYIAECDGELTFTEGTFVKELSDCDRPGWYVGMLADGTTGLYPADHFVPSPVTAQSEA